MERPSWQSRTVLSAVERWRQKIREDLKYTPNGSSIPEDVWRSRHKRILIGVVAHIPLLLALGLYEGTESVVTGATIPSIPTWLVVGQLSIVLALALLSNWSRFSRRTRTAIGSFGLMTTSTLLVQFSGGYIEAHFHFFVVMGVIALYEDWLPFAIGLLYVATGHVIFSMIDPTRVYNHTAAIEYPWAWAGIHAVFILGLSGALISNWYSIERSREESEARLREVTAQTNQLQDIEEAKAEAERQREEVKELATTIEQRANEYGEVMRKCANGDLTQRMDTSSDHEAMADIATTFNRMMDDLSETIVRIQEFADEVAVQSEEATASVESVQYASEEVRGSTQEIATGAEHQTEQLVETVDEMNTLSASVEEVAAAANQVAATSEQAADRGEDAQDHARNAIAEMSVIERRTEQAVEDVESLDDEIKRISEIIELINGIAEQTNLLALNASIEAARAGEAGDGFAVVADEIKQLAGEASRATTDIETLIGEIVASTEGAVDDMQATGESITDGVETVEETLDAVEDVVAQFDEVNQGVQEISKATDEQSTSTEEVVGMVEEVTGVSEQTAAEASTVSTASEQQLDSLEEVSTSVNALSARADRLHALLDAFEVGDAVPVSGEPVAADRTRTSSMSVSTDGGFRFEN
ncbi:Methyl-accepting chemotaxis protein [Halogranum gelatinilyticum]|uniref:Methyl-accepting chemotaxis protein n=1 Tax=Halogranum gelatinilyticum TaxID=660521 RepID=A0A1G9Q5A8_9EURY|nr:methyl-accepting chemotaxis protein [Halogranum gelatinilyticum]SDM05931.1 Methyl-accepting chemotaxis protein [Halogranum gelatinilyticum]